LPKKSKHNKKISKERTWINNNNNT
jgi:hypothetical protein